MAILMGNMVINHRILGVHYFQTAHSYQMHGVRVHQGLPVRQVIGDEEERISQNRCVPASETCESITYRDYPALILNTIHKRWFSGGYIYISIYIY